MSGSTIDTCSVLIVEDDINLASLYEAQLSDHFDVHVVTSGDAALDHIDESIDLILLDRSLPGMSGKSVLDELRERGYDLPVIMVTGVEPDVDIVDMPFDEYLTKPVDGESLKRTVQIVANRASFEQKSRELFRIASMRETLHAADVSENGHSPEETALIGRIAALREDLDETLTDVISDDLTVVSRSDPNQTEIEALLSEVTSHALPPDIQALADQYQEFRSARSPFIWKWVHHLAPNNTLPCVDEEFRDTVPIDKTIATLFVTLLDDVLEKQGDQATFTELAKLPFADQRPDPRQEGVDTEYVKFSEHVWETLIERIQRAPKYSHYEDLFRYDMKQVIAAIEYSDLAIRRPELATMRDLERYQSHNMVMFAYADIDFMHTTSNIEADFPAIREAIWTAQLMARIGNWVSTWEREFQEGDFSSGPIIYALEQGIISHEELHRARNDESVATALVERIKANGIEEEFLSRWEQHYHQLREYNMEVGTVDLEPFIEGTEEVLRYHLASTGLK